MADVKADGKAAEVLRPILQGLIDKLLHEEVISYTQIVQMMEAGFQRSGHRAPRPDGWRRRVLVLRMDEIGDNVLGSAFLRELRRVLPDAEIDLLVKKTAYPMMEYCPYADHVAGVQVPKELVTEQLFPWILELCNGMLWERQYDLCVLPRWDVDECLTTLLAFACGARERVAFSERVSPIKRRLNKGYDRLLTRVAMTPPYAVHEVEKSLYLLRAFGARAQRDDVELWLDTESVASAKARLAAASGRPVAVAVSTREARKTYPPKKLAAALKELLDTDATFFLLGGPDDQKAAATVARALPKDRVVNVAGKTQLRESAALIGMSALYLGGDTGLTHIAAAAHRPIVEWFCHPQDTMVSVNSAFARFYPWQAQSIVLQPEHAAKECRKVLTEFSEIAGCNSKFEAHCIKNIDPHAIAAAARRFLK